MQMEEKEQLGVLDELYVIAAILNNRLKDTGLVAKCMTTIKGEKMFPAIVVLPQDSIALKELEEAEEQSNNITE